MYAALMSSSLAPSPTCKRQCFQSSAKAVTAETKTAPGILHAHLELRQGLASPHLHGVCPPEHRGSRFGAKKCCARAIHSCELAHDKTWPETVNGLRAAPLASGAATTQRAGPAESQLLPTSPTLHNATALTTVTASRGAGSSGGGGRPAGASRVAAIFAARRHLLRSAHQPHTMSL